MFLILVVSSLLTPALLPMSLSGPYLRMGPRAAIFQGRHIKKIKIDVWYAEKKGCPRERNLREIYTENRMCSS